MMMKGLVSHPNGDLTLSEVPVPKIGENVYAPRDVLLEVKYCGIDLAATSNECLRVAIKP
jgi:threonine dehydrogenase-like Zn-dependent dehydrogenase